MKHHNSNIDVAQSVKEIYLTNPGITKENIANQLHITPARVGQSLKQLDLKPNRPHVPRSAIVEAVIRMRRNNACATLQEIGDKLGVSKQYVYQILNRADLHTKHYSQKIQYECPVCGKISHRKFCSDECQKKWHEVPIVCATCGKLFIRKQSQLLAHSDGNRFCSRECFGKWAGENYGFKAHPEHATNYKRPPKWDYPFVWKTHLETGYGPLRLSRLLIMPEGTVTYILKKFRDKDRLTQNLEVSRPKIVVPKPFYTHESQLLVSQLGPAVFNLENPDVKFSEQERAARQAFWYKVTALDKEYYLGTINLVAKDLAYFAGIFDTEVHFSISSIHSINMSYVKHNEDLLKIFSSSFGGEIRKVKPQPDYKRDIWSWNVNADQAYKILKKIHPFLRINREKARLCIECYEKCAIRGLTYADKAKIGEQYIKLLKNRKTKPEQRFDYFGLPHLKIAYLAGVFDVDSSFVITRRTEPGKNTYLLEVIKRKNDYETMQFIRGTFGGKIHVASRSRLSKQDVWELKYSSQKAYAILKQIYPFLKAQKRIAEICVEFQDRYY